MAGPEGLAKEHICVATATDNSAVMPEARGSRDWGEGGKVGEGNICHGVNNKNKGKEELGLYDEKTRMSLKDSSRSPWLLAIGSIPLFNSMLPVNLLSIIIPIVLNKDLFQDKYPYLEKSQSLQTESRWIQTVFICSAQVHIHFLSEVPGCCYFVLFPPLPPLQK